METKKGLMATEDTSGVKKVENNVEPNKKSILEKNRVEISPSKQRIMEKYLVGISSRSKRIQKAHMTPSGSKKNKEDMTSPQDDDHFKLQLKMGLCSSQETKSNLKFFANLGVTVEAIFRCRMSSVFKKLKGKDTSSVLELLPPSFYTESRQSVESWTRNRLEGDSDSQIRFSRFADRANYFQSLAQILTNQTTQTKEVGVSEQSVIIGGNTRSFQNPEIVNFDKKLEGENEQIEAEKAKSFMMEGHYRLFDGVKGMETLKMFKNNPNLEQYPNKFKSLVGGSRDVISPNNSSPSERNHKSHALESNTDYSGIQYSENAINLPIYTPLDTGVSEVNPSIDHQWKKFKSNDLSHLSHFDGRNVKQNVGCELGKMLVKSFYTKKRFCYLKMKLIALKSQNSESISQLKSKFKSSSLNEDLSSTEQIVEVLKRSLFSVDEVDEEVSLGMASPPAKEGHKFTSLDKENFALNESAISKSLLLQGSQQLDIQLNKINSTLLIAQIVQKIKQNRTLRFWLNLKEQTFRAQYDPLNNVKAQNTVTKGVKKTDFITKSRNVKLGFNKLSKLVKNTERLSLKIIKTKFRLKKIVIHSRVRLINILLSNVTHSQKKVTLDTIKTYSRQQKLLHSKTKNFENRLKSLLKQTKNKAYSFSKIKQIASHNSNIVFQAQNLTSLEKNLKVNQMKVFILDSIFSRIKLNLMKSYFYLLLPMTTNTIYSKPQSVFVHETYSHFSDAYHDELRDSALTRELRHMNSSQLRKNKFIPHSQQNYESPQRTGSTSLRQFSVSGNKRNGRERSLQNSVKDFDKTLNQQNKKKSKFELKLANSEFGFEYGFRTKTPVPKTNSNMFEKVMRSNSKPNINIPRIKSEKMMKIARKISKEDEVEPPKTERKHTQNQINIMDGNFSNSKTPPSSGNFHLPTTYKSRAQSGVLGKTKTLNLDHSTSIRLKNKSFVPMTKDSNNVTQGSSDNPESHLLNIKTMENSLEISLEKDQDGQIKIQNSIFTGPVIPRLKILSEKKKKQELSQIEEANSQMIEFTPRNTNERGQNSAQKYSQYANPTLGLKAKLLQMKKQSNEKLRNGRKSKNTTSTSRLSLKKYASRDHLKNFESSSAKKTLNLFSNIKFKGQNSDKKGISLFKQFTSQSQVVALSNSSKSIQMSQEHVLRVSTE